MRKGLEIGGVVAAILLIAFGVAAVVLGASGKSTVTDSITREVITGTPDMAPEAIKAEVKATSDDVRRTVPVDTGTLRDSVRSKQKELVGEVHITARHARFVEFGTSRSPAQPYAAPAAARARVRLPRRVSQLIKVALDRP